MADAKECRQLVLDCLNVLAEHNLEPVLGYASSMAYAYYQSPLYDYSECSFELNTSRKMLPEIKKWLENLEGVSCEGADNGEPCCTLTVTRDEVSVTLTMLFNLYGNLTDVTERCGLLVSELNFTIIQFAAYAEKHAACVEKVPLGYSKVFKPSTDVYHALALYSLFKSELKRETVERVYKLLNYVRHSTIQFKDLSAEEQKQANTWLEAAFSATWEEKYRG